VAFYKQEAESPTLPISKQKLVPVQHESDKYFVESPGTALLRRHYKTFFG